MNLYELGKYKNTVISVICGNDDICKAIFGDSYNVSDIDDELFGEQVLPYLFVPGAQEDAKVYVCVETAIPRTIGFELKDVKLIVQVVCHKDLIKYRKKGYSGNRTDILSDMVNRQLNSSRDFGIGRLKLESVDIINTDKFYGRSMIYKCPDFNVRDKL